MPKFLCDFFQKIFPNSRGKITFLLHFAYFYFYELPKNSKKILENHFKRNEDEVQTVYIGVDEKKFNPEKYKQVIQFAEAANGDRPLRGLRQNNYIHFTYVRLWILHTFCTLMVQEVFFYEENMEIC